MPSSSSNPSPNGLSRRSFVSGVALLAGLTLPAAALAAQVTSSSHDGEAAIGSSARDASSSSGTESSFVKDKLEEIEKNLDGQLGGSPQADPDAHLGILLSSTSNEFWATAKTRYEEGANKLGVNVQFFEPSSETDAQGQLDVLNTIVGMGFDAIIFSPINGTNLLPGLVAANEAGVPVVNWGPGVDTDALAAAGGHIDGKVTISFEDQGKIAAEDLVKRIPEGGKVAILAGLAGAAQSEGRANGAVGVFKSTDGIELVANQACDWDTTKAYEATKDILTAHPDLRGFFACNDNMALAGVKALQELGKTDVLMYGVDYTSAGKAALQAGTMTGSVTASNSISTKVTEKLALLLAQGAVPGKTIYNQPVLITKDDVNEYEGWK